ncbi:F-box/FBD/LRR-repeat protein [Raphanus sativus]|nr:F-box/FBD/LRR-repeat protein [Raphanus sativus]
MEQRLRRRLGYVNADRISELPEALLVQILSLLPTTKHVIVTSVLSKGWRSLWKMVPRLVFASPSQKFEDKVISTSLLSHEAPVLESFRLRLVRDEYMGDIRAWLGIAFARHVREMVLDVNFQVSFPGSMFCSASSLETLILKNSIHVDVPYPVSMKSLKTLHLHDVTYKEDESVRNLLSGCPSLEDLLVDRGYSIHDAKIFTIVVPSLKRLAIYDPCTVRKGGGYVINAPCLKYLEIEMIIGCDFCLIENSPELVEATIRNVSRIVNETILRSLKPTKRLSLNLSPLEINCPTSTIFYQLVYLDVYAHKAEWWNLLILMLNNSPKLQVLKITGCLPCAYGTNHCLVGKKLSEQEYVPECLSQLETFVWKNYDWTSEVKKEVATYILKNAIRLKKAAFCINSITVKCNELEERLQMLKELVSNPCHFVSKFE